MLRRNPLVLATVVALVLGAAGVLTAGAAEASTAAAPPAVRSAAVHSVTAAAVTLTWTNPAKATSTVIRVAKGSTAPKSVKAGLAVAMVKAPGHSIAATRLAAETAYTFALFSTPGHGKYSKAVVVHAVTAPAAVTKLHGSSTETTATVAWTNPSAATFTTVVARYARGATAPARPTSGTAVRLSTAKASTATVSSLFAGTTYAFAVWTLDSHKRYSAAATVKVATLALPGSVTNLTQTIQAPAAVLGWKNPSAATFTGVRVCRVDGLSGSAPAPGTCDGAVDLGKVTSYTDSTVAVGTGYTYWAFAHDAYGHYAPGASVAVVGPPPPVTSPSARSLNPTTALITWTATSGTNIQLCRVAAGAAAPDFGACDGPHLFTSMGGQYFDRTALPGRAYDYYVYVRDGQNQLSVPAKASVTMPTPAGATVEGTVIAADAASGVSGVKVDLIAPNGRLVTDTDNDGVLDSDVLATTTTHPDGTYSFIGGNLGLTPSNVGAYVCFDAFGSSGTHQTGYASQCAAGAGWDTDVNHPTGAPVSLTAGTIDTVDATLGFGGGLAGTITSAGKAAAGAEVDVYSTTTGQQGYTVTELDGSYQITGLNPGTYDVCVSRGVSKAAPTGYAPQCYHGAVSGSSTLPTAVTVRASAITRGINDAVGSGGAITGVIDDAITQDALEDVDVYVFDAAGRLVDYYDTAANGAYTIAGLPTGVPLTVCVDGEYATENDSNPGHDAECYQGAAWDVEDAPGPATPVTLAAKQTRVLDFHLSLTGGVTGTVTNANAVGVAGVGVSVFSSATNAAGDPLEWDGVTDSAGNYLVGGLPTGTYRVCFDASPTGAGSVPSAGYLSQCNGGQPWDGGAPAGDTVTVTAGSETPVAATLAQAGGIAGVARSSSGAVLTDVTVSAFDASGALAATARSQYDGSYALTSLLDGSYRLCWSGAQSVDASTGTGHGSGCLGATGSWSGGAPLAGASSLDVQAGQLTAQDLSLAPVAAGAHVAARSSRAAAATSESSLLPIRAAQVLARHGRRVHGG